MQTAAFLKPLTSLALKAFAEYLKKKIESRKQSKDLDTSPVEKAIERHLQDVERWSRHFQFLEMSAPGMIDETTIKLSLHTEPRKFRGDNTTRHKNEEDLVSDLENYVVLGEPGSGKTTTLKRLVRYLLTSPPQSDTDIYQVPLVIRLRELQRGKTLHMAIADIFGFRYKHAEVIRTYEKEHQKASTIAVTHMQTLIQGSRIEVVIPDLLNETGAVLILDGLDEVFSDIASGIRNEIIELGRKLTKAKIIVSSRTGDYTIQLEGFCILEICPLSKKQVTSIAKKWLGNPHDFLKSLENLPYRDLTDRPLLLTQLLFIFKRYGYLPEQPSSIYKRVIRLLLEDWDAQRGITRQSKYSQFDPERKSDFLAGLSYHLTYVLREKRFTEDQLANAYLRINDTFNLPKDEARQVACEIQTHTGIIVIGPHDTYEFSHLSIQEYLCANYLLRAPLPPKLTDYIQSYCAPLAVAVALSSRPGEWFANLVFSRGNLPAFNDACIISLISRISTEQPFFELSEQLGLAILALFDKFRDQKHINVQRMLMQFCEVKGVLDSVRAALRWFCLARSSKSDGHVDARLRRTLINPYTIDLPKKGAIPKDLLARLQAIRGTPIMWSRADGVEKALTVGLLKELIK
jgi:DNA polymerase III delta prime subunit